MSEEFPHADRGEVALISHQLRPLVRQEVSDGEFVDLVEQQKFEHCDFERCEARKVTFRNVSFLQSVFKDCYFRNCTFDHCDFIGVRFVGTILRGCTFPGSKFDYARFAHSLVPTELLERNMPPFENVSLELARSLRVNYSQFGDSDGVNKAIIAELSATRVHLWKAAWSREVWYRQKYQGFERFRKMVEYCSFSSFHLLWGNGESWFKLCCTMVLAHVAVAICIWQGGTSFHDSLYWSFLIFWGVTAGVPASAGLMACTTALRLVLLSLLVTLLVRRFSRR